VVGDQTGVVQFPAEDVVDDEDSCVALLADDVGVLTSDLGLLPLGSSTPHETLLAALVSRHDCGNGLMGSMREETLLLVKTSLVVEVDRSFWRGSTCKFMFLSSMTLNGAPCADFAPHGGVSCFGASGGAKWCPFVLVLHNLCQYRYVDASLQELTTCIPLCDTATFARALLGVRFGATLRP